MLLTAKVAKAEAVRLLSQNAPSATAAAPQPKIWGTLRSAKGARGTRSIVNHEADEDASWPKKLTGESETSKWQFPDVN
jgi:hypothetical protein